MSEPAIRIRGLSKEYRICAQRAAYGTFREAVSGAASAPFRWLRSGNGSHPAAERLISALRDVSFDVQPGEVVGVIGRNGAGKSTLLKVVSRITEPTEGRVEVRGRVASLLEVGTGFHPELSGRENIFLNGAILGMSRREITGRFDEIVSFAEVEPFIDTPVKRYSSGMYLRLAFAVAAHLEPEILLVDEVLAVGDAEFQKKCLGRMKQVAAGGRTVLFVSHNEGAVRRLCGRAVLLAGGKLTQDGAPDEVYATYREATGSCAFDPVNRLHRSDDLRLVDAYLTINGERTSTLVSGDHPVVTYVIDVLRPVVFGPELLVRDASSIPILFFSLALTRGTTYRLERGSHRLAYCLSLPPLADGPYAMDLMLAQPRRRFYDYVESGLRFSVVGSGSVGWSFTQARGQGCVLLHADDVPVEPPAAAVPLTER